MDSPRRYGDTEADDSAPVCCPICGAIAESKHRHSVERVAASHSPPTRDVDRYRRMLVEVRRLWPAGFVDACVCPACLLGFAWPLVEGDSGFYSLLHERVGYPRDRWEFRRAHEQFIKSTDRVLDIGAGRGDFLASLPASVEKHAVEASRTLCDALAARGIIAHADLDAAAAAGPYDVVTLFHVLQYFADPVDALTRCRAMLAANGRVLISLPNATAGGSIDSLPAPPHPLTRWTKTSLERAVAAAGLTVDGFDWIPRGATSLLWDANAKTRVRAAEHSDSLAARIDAMRPGRMRTVALTILATLELPSVLLHARSRLSRSQMFVVCRACA